MTFIKCNGVVIGDLYIPKFRLKKGDLFCMHWPLPANTEMENEFIKYLIGKKKSDQINIYGVVEKATPLVPEKKLFPFARETSLGNVIKKLANGAAVNKLLTVCKELEIDVDSKILSISLTKRALLGIEIALSNAPDVILFDICGLDPSGVQAIFDSVSDKLSDIAVIYFSYPAIPERVCYTGADQHIKVADEGGS